MADAVWPQELNIIKCDELHGWLFRLQVSLGRDWWCSNCFLVSGMSSETSMYFSYFPRMRAMWLVSIKFHLFEVVVDFSNFDFQNLYNRSCNINVMILLMISGFILFSLGFCPFALFISLKAMQTISLHYLRFFFILFKCHPCSI
jgi:hypothetical protein